MKTGCRVEEQDPGTSHKNTLFGAEPLKRQSAALAADGGEPAQQHPFLPFFLLVLTLSFLSPDFSFLSAAPSTAASVAISAALAGAPTGATDSTAFATAGAHLAASSTISCSAIGCPAMMRLNISGEMFMRCGSAGITTYCCGSAGIATYCCGSVGISAYIVADMAGAGEGRASLKR